MNFEKVIGRLIALQNIWKLFTPIVIYFVLKYFTNWYQILAWLDVVAWIIAVIFVVLMFFNALLHFWAYYFVDNNFILTIFFVFISFTIGIYWPTWNHLVMSFTNIAEKATVRSMFLMIIWIFEALMLFILSFASLSTGLLILSILIFIWFIVWSLYFLKK